jgi:NAD(P)-dependent dehydrogenase (short-subunit alcohol dehydrogenase family)
VTASTISVAGPLGRGADRLQEIGMADDTTFNPEMLRGKAALISGGTSGIGLGIAMAFAAHGAKVAVVGRDLAKAEAAAAGIGEGALAFSADVRDFAAVEAAVGAAADAFGPLDIVVAGAAGNFLAPAAGMSANAFKSVVDIDLLGTFNVFRAAHGRLNKPGASLIAILAGQAFRPMQLQAHACAAKAGVAMLVKCLALEWGPEGVRVNGLTPGPVEGTEGMARLLPKAFETQFLEALPLGRMQRLDEIVAGALFLASDAASYVTGAALDCDGGSNLARATMSMGAPSRS